MRMSNTTADFWEDAYYLYYSDIDRFYKCQCIPFTSKTVLYVASDATYVKKKIEAESNHTVVYINARSSHSVREMRAGQFGGGH